MKYDNWALNYNNYHAQMNLTRVELLSRKPFFLIIKINVTLENVTLEKQINT